MDEQTTDYETSTKNGNDQTFNWALFLGLCIVALSIFITGRIIAINIPNSLHGSLHGNFSGTLMDGSNPSREFMSEWETARFLMMSYEELELIIESGELNGTYAVFQVERNVMQSYDISGQWMTIDGGFTAEIPFRHIEYETIIVDQRIFSRERLVEWLLNRMDN